MTKIAPSDRLITKRELCHIVPYTPQHILRLEKRGRFPRRIQVGPNRVAWLLSEVEAWISDRAAERTSNRTSNDALLITATGQGSSGAIEQAPSGEHTGSPAYHLRPDAFRSCTISSRRASQSSRARRRSGRKS